MKGRGTFLIIEDIFERVHTHLLAQQRRSEDADGEPRYRRFDNRRYGVGILTDDAFYYSATERLGASLLYMPGEGPLAYALRRSGVGVDDN